VGTGGVGVGVGSQGSGIVKLDGSATMSGLLLAHALAVTSTDEPQIILNVDLLPMVKSEVSPFFITELKTTAPRK
jgi:hypothetical protein